MKKILKYFFEKFGILIITKKSLEKNQFLICKNDFALSDSDITYIKARGNKGLNYKLIKEGRTNWLEIGCGGTFEKFFTYIDLFPETVVNAKGKYYRIDIVNATEIDLDRLGKFDLIRMQHVFEHFSPEDGIKVLKTCSQLLNKDGYVLITAPDLRKYINLYLSGKIRENFEWALKRINKESPDSFYFSIFSHSMKYEKHEWCYDAEGLIYQLELTQKFKNIKEIKIDDELANIPFTHNRPTEDVCVIAQLK